MNPPVVLEEHTLLLIVVLMLLAGAMIGAICQCIHGVESRLPAHERKPWFAWAGVFILLVLAVRPQPDLPVGRTVQAPTPADKLTVHLTDCPPGSGLTNQYIFTVESRADADPVVTGCTRIAERQYLVNH